jgi:hypothetical protein
MSIFVSQYRCQSTAPLKPSGIKEYTHKIEELYLTEKISMGHGLLWGLLYFLYVDDIRTSQETYLWASTVCCGNGFTFPLTFTPK